MLLDHQDLLEPQVELDLLVLLYQELVTEELVEREDKEELEELGLLEEHLVIRVEQEQQVLLETLEQQVLLDLTVIIKTVLLVVLDRLEHQDHQVLLEELLDTT